MDVKMLCMGCMRKLHNDSVFCEYCGYKVNSVNSSRGLQPRTILNGKYLVGKIIGEGGFGITYLAYDMILNYRVAIKEYFPSELVTRDTSTGVQTALTVLTGSKEEQYKAGIERFMNEARNLAAFNNLDGIVSVKEFFYENNTAYMVMEYIDGNPLSKFLNGENKLLYKQVLAMMTPVMNSLEKVHEGNIIHRDISPDNIMFTKEGNLKLIDFGAARVVDSDNKSLTVILKHGYAPEEQYQSGGNQGPWTDVYALAALMYQMITGTVPQEATDRIISGDKVVPVNKLVPEVPRHVSDAIMHGLAIKASDRPQSVSVFRKELEKEPKKKFPFFIIPIAAAVLCFVAGILFYFLCKGKGTKNNDEKLIAYESSEQTKGIIEGELYEKSEKELVSNIEKDSGLSVKYGIYEDYNLDGIREYYAYACTNSETESKNEEGGQVWFADSAGAVMVFDVEKEVVTCGQLNNNLRYGLLHFENGTHFYIIRNDGENKEGVEEITFAYENGVPRKIYQGTELISEEENHCYIERIQQDNSSWDWDPIYRVNTYKIEYPMKYEITYREGYYYEYSFSLIPDENVFNLSINPESLTQGIERIKKEKAIINNEQYSYEEYPYIVYGETFYCSNGHLYKNVSFYDSEQANANICNQGDVPQKLEACLEFAPINGNFEFLGFAYGKREESLTASSNAFFMPIQYETILSDNTQSEEQYKNELLNKIKKYFGNYSDVEMYSDFVIEGIRYIFDDFNDDGKKEMVAVVNTPIENPYPGGQFSFYRHQAILYVNDTSLLVFDEGDYGDESNSVEQLVDVSFGKRKMFSYSTSDWVGYSQSYIFSVDDEGINCINMRKHLPDNLWDASVIVSEKGVFVDYKVYVNYDVNGKEYYLDGSAVNAFSGDCIKLWYLNDRFVECASIEINEDELREYSGAEDVLNNMDEIVKSYSDNCLGRPVYGEFNSDDYQIDSILKCSDDYIYINYVPFKNHTKYRLNVSADVDGVFSYTNMETYTIRLSYTDDKVQFDSVYQGYREPRMTEFEAYYPK